MSTAPSHESGGSSSSAPDQTTEALLNPAQEPPSAVEDDPAASSSNSGPRPPQQTPEEVSQILESILHGWVNAINTRQIHLSNPVYDSIDPKFSTTPKVPWQPKFEKPMALPEYLDLLNWACETVPTYGLRIIDMNTVIVDERHADVVMNFEVLGAFGDTGLTYRSVALVKFRRGKGGKWLCFTFEAIDGMENTEGGVF